MFTVQGNWQVSLQDGAHTVRAELSLNNVVRVYFDDALIHDTYIFYAQGEVYKFNKDNHDFSVQLNGVFRPAMSFALLMDGSDVALGRVAEVKFTRELNVSEHTDVIDTEEIPIDNTAGSGVLTLEHELSKTVTNELSLGRTFELGGEVKIDVLRLLEAKLSAKLGMQSAQKIGQSITERRKVTLSVQPQSAVLYTIVWKRKVRSGDYLVSIDGVLTPVPYCVRYGLSYELKSRRLPV